MYCTMPDLIWTLSLELDFTPSDIDHRVGRLEVHNNKIIISCSKQKLGVKQDLNDSLVPLEWVTLEKENPSLKQSPILMVPRKEND